MNLLADENVPRGTVGRLRALGCDVASIQEIGPGMVDRDVIGLARQEGRILLTFDKDFGELAFRSGLPADCGIVLIRLRESSPLKMQERVTSALMARDDWRGHFSVIEADRIRMRPIL